MYRYLVAIFVVQLSACLAEPVTHQGRELLNITAAAQFAAEKLGKHLLSGNGFLDQDSEFTYLYNLNLKVHSPIVDEIEWITVALSFTEDGYSLENVGGPVPASVSGESVERSNCTQGFEIFETIPKYIANRLDAEYIDRHAGYLFCDLAGLHTMQQQIKLRTLSPDRTAWFWVVSYLTAVDGEITALSIETFQQFRWPNDEEGVVKHEYLEF